MQSRLSPLEQAQLEILTRQCQDDEDRARCRGKGGLMNFIRLMWKVIEPERPLVEGWVLEALCEHLEAVTFRQINRLLINVPPGSTKSLTAAVFWPAWEWGPNGLVTFRYMCASYSGNLSRRDNIRFRRLLMSPEYQRLWGDVFGPSADQFSIERVSNDKTGWKLATSVGGVGTGERADRVIIDDGNNPLESESEAIMDTTRMWFTEVIPDRLNNLDESAIINIQQRTNEADISGIILELGLPYTHLCYDDQTEILSRNGWVRFADLPAGAEVMAVCPETLDAGWQKIQARVAYQYDGDLIHYRSAVADLAVTPDHRMVYKDYNDWRSKDAGPWRVRPAKDLPRHFYLPQAIRWIGTDTDVEFGGLLWNPMNFAQFMGWYLAEGCASAARCNARIVQKEGASADVIRSILAEVPCSDRVSEAAHGPNGCRVWMIYGKALATALAELGSSHNKRAPEGLKALTPKCLREFILAYASGDGSKAGRNGHGIQISSRSKRMIDDLQECCAKAGWAATVHERTISERRFNGYTLPGGQIHVLYIRTAKTEGRPRKWSAKIRKDNVGVLPYSGTVYCVSVPATALLVRRNGRMAVSGNCIPMEYDPSRHCATEIGWQDPRGLDDYGMPLTGHALEQATGILAWPERFSPGALADLYKAKGPYAVSGQYQQLPTPRGGGLFQREWIEPWPPADPDGSFPLSMLNERGGIKLPALEYVVGWVDTAYTEKQENDFSAMTVVGIFRAEGRGTIVPNGNGTFTRVADDYGFPKAIVLHAWQKRLTIHGPPMEIPAGISEKEWNSPRFADQRREKWGLVEWVADTVRRYKVDYLGIETQAVGITLQQELSRLHLDLSCSVELVPARGDKVARGYAVQGSFSSRQIYFPTYEDGSYPSWLNPLADQLFVFPKGAHDDLVDSLTGAIKHLRDTGLFERREEFDRAEQHEMSWQTQRRVPMPYDV